MRLWIRKNNNIIPILAQTSQVKVKDFMIFDVLVYISEQIN